MRGNWPLNGREVLGLAAAPLPFLFPFLLMLCVVLAERGPGEAWWILGPAAMLVAAAYGPLLLFGLPLHLLLRRNGRTNLVSYVAGALACALMLTGASLALAMLASPTPAQNPFGLHLSALGAVALGVLLSTAASVCAAIFWFIAVRPRRA